MKKMEINDWFLFFKWGGYILGFIAFWFGVGAFVTSQKMKVDKPLTYEESRLKELKKEIELLSKSPLYNLPDLTVSAVPTENEKEILLHYLRNDLIEVPGSLGPTVADQNTNFQQIVNQVSRIFARSNENDKFENLILDVANNKIGFSNAQRTNFIEGITSYLYEKDPFEKKDLYLAIIESSKDINAYVGGPSLSFQYFNSFLHLAEKNDKNKFDQLINSHQFVDNLKLNGIISEYIKVTSPDSWTHSRKEFLEKVEGSYLIEIINIELQTE